VKIQIKEIEGTKDEIIYEINRVFRALYGNKPVVLAKDIAKSIRVPDFLLFEFLNSHKNEILTYTSNGHLAIAGIIQELNPQIEDQDQLPKLPKGTILISKKRHKKVSGGWISIKIKIVGGPFRLEVPRGIMYLTNEGLKTIDVIKNNYSVKEELCREQV
jgi:hypothetical protein